jgi:hypothetical protein
MNDMTSIKTYTAGIIAALGIAGAALAGAGTAAALTDQPGQPNITPSPSFAPRHVDPAPGIDGDILHGYLGSPGRHHYGHRGR